MTNKEMMDWIDGASYQELLERWRFGRVGDPFFCGDVGEHFTKTLVKKRDEVGSAAASTASKAIGWEK